MKKVFDPLTLSLIIVALVLGMAAGYYISPSYQQTMYSKEEMGLGNADRFVDIRYINRMATHHRGAMLLAEQISTKTNQAEIKDLAGDILKNEPKLIEELYVWKKEWYRDSRPAADPIVANLGPADKNTDLRFLNALIYHHEEGIAMTKEIRTKSSRAEILDNADAVEQFLTKSLIMLKEWRKNWYNVT